MGCCCTKKPVGEESAYDNNGKKSGVSPAATRKCRDVLCCLFFLVFWVGMIIVAIIGLLNGQPKRLLYGSDRNGTTCGTGHLVDKPLTFYPRMNEDLLEQAVNPKLKPIDFEFTGYCVSVCPLQYSYFCNYEFEDSLAADTTLKTEVDRDAKRKAEANKILGEKNCWFVAMPNEKVFYRCIQMTQTNATSVETCIYPADAPEFYETVNGIKRPNALCEVKTVRTISDATGPAQVSPIYDKLQTSAAMVGRALGDIQNSWPVVLVIGGGVAFALGFVFLLLMKYFAGCVVWITLWSFVLMLLLFSLMLSTKAGIIDDSQMGQLSSKLSDAGLVTATQNGFQVPDNLRASNDKQKIYRIAAYVSYGLTGVAFLLVCFFQKKVRIAVGIIKEASRAIQSMPLLLLFPIVPFLMIVVLFIYSAIIAAFIYSIGDVIKLDKLGGSAATTSATVFNKVSANDTMRILVAYHFFGFLWTNQLINAISMCTIAGAVCRYYWSREKSTAEMGRFPVLYSFKNCFRYHFGSLAFGSFIIAVVQFIRAILMYIDHQTQDLQNGNLIIKVMMKVVQCCLWCLEKCLKFLSKNAYIMIAMNGKSFCVSAKDSFKLLFSNLGQIATVSLVSYLLVLAAKVAIAIACAVIAIAYIEKNQIKYGIGGTNEISSPMAPILLTLLLAWFVASTLLGVYEMAIDTILLCFCEDKEMNKATGMYFMSEHLQKFIASVPATGNIQGGGGATASPPASPGTGNI